VNSIAEAKIQAWKMDHRSTQWADGLVEITWAINGQVHSTTGKMPWEIVFQAKKLVNNWLPLAEQQAAIRVPCENGGYITEADLKAEI
jgi:hypothetical protein